jgi:hypothetical protein
MAIRGMKVGGRRRNSIDGKETVIQWNRNLMRLKEVDTQQQRGGKVTHKLFSLFFRQGYRPLGCFRLLAMIVRYCGVLWVYNSWSRYTAVLEYGMLVASIAFCCLCKKVIVALHEPRSKLNYFQDFNRTQIQRSYALRKKHAIHRFRKPYLHVHCNVETWPSAVLKLRWDIFTQMLT